MPQKRSAADLLAEIPLFASLPRAELLALVERIHKRKYRRGEAIVHFADQGSSLFIIAAGAVKVTRLLASGEEAVISVLDAGEFFGEMALLDNRPRSASVYALEPTELLVLHREDLLAFLRANPEAAIEIIVVLADRIRKLNDQVGEAYYMDLSQRLARRLQDLAAKRGRPTPDGVELDIVMTQSELAAMVGASRQRINRLLGQWQDSRIIRLGRESRITILRPDALAELCL